MMQVALEHNHFAHISVSRKFRLTEDCTVSVNNVVRNPTIKNFLIVAPDAANALVIEQNLVIRDFLITAERGHYNEF